MRRFDVIYFTNMDLFSRKAHVIQITQTVAALSALGLKVKLVVKKAGRNPACALEEIGIHRGTENLKIIEYKGDSFPLLLAERAVFYTRSITWAKRLLRLKAIHKNPVVFETHRKLVYYKNDPETGITKGLKDKGILEYIYYRADGVVCACERTYHALKQRGVNTIHLWYGWAKEVDTNITASQSINMGYIGFKEELYMTVEALKNIPFNFRFHIFGGSGTEISSFRNKVDDEIKDRLVFHGFIKHKDLHSRARICGTMIAANEGIKLADYLSIASAIIAPDLPSIRGILGNSACYFKFNNVDSLREAVARVISDSALYIKLRERSARLRSKYVWPHKGIELLKFIEGIM